MIVRRPNIKTYDPKFGQDYAFFNHSTKTTFSSLEHGFFVLEAVGEMDWGMHQAMLLECIIKTSTKGFFLVAPWYPGAEKLRRALLQQFSDAQVLENAVLGYFDPATDELGKLFAIRGEHGRGSSGEWCIGGCLTKFSKQNIKCSGGNLSCLLPQSGKIGCVLSLEEMQQSYFIIKIFEGLPKIIGEISAGVAL